MLRKTLLLCLLFVPAVASAADLNLPAQPMASALQEISKLSGIPIDFAPELVKDLGAPALEGDYSIETALDTLLAGSNLTYHVLEAGENGKIQITKIDEVQITGRYEKLSAMLKEAEQLEVQFYKEYNSLNTDHQWDVNCRLEGVHIKQRVCTPVFVDNAWHDVQWGRGGSSWVYIQAKMPAYQQNLREKVAKNPKLVELLMKQKAAQERYVAMRKKKFEGGKIFVWD